MGCGLGVKIESTDITKSHASHHHETKEFDMVRYMKNSNHRTKQKLPKPQENATNVAPSTSQDNA